MDPNKTLEAIRAMYTAILEDGRIGSATRKLAEDIEALDEWLSKGGYLPLDWAGRPLR